MKSVVEKGSGSAKAVVPVSHSSRRAKVIRSLMINGGRALLARCKAVVPGWLERKGA